MKPSYRDSQSDSAQLNKYNRSIILIVSTQPRQYERTVQSWNIIFVPNLKRVSIANYRKNYNL